MTNFHLFGHVSMRKFEVRFTFDCFIIGYYAQIFWIFGICMRNEKEMDRTLYACAQASTQIHMKINFVRLIQTMNLLGAWNHKNGRKRERDEKKSTHTRNHLLENQILITFWNGKWAYCVRYVFDTFKIILDLDTFHE